MVNLFWGEFSEENANAVLVVRHQNFGLCFLHAVVVMESYLIAIATAFDERKWDY